MATFIALSMLAMFPDWTESAVRTARNGTVLSFGVGILGIICTFVLGLVLAFFMFFPIVGFIIGFVVFLPLLAFGLASYAVSIITLGAAISLRLGKDSIWLGVFVGAIAIVVLNFVPIVGPIVVFIVETLGFGAALRVTFGSGVSKQTERTVPPAHSV